MSKIRKSARGQDCQIQLFGICNHNPETVVFAHYNKGGLGGMGIKALDAFGAYACSSCHDEIDRRTRHLDSDEAELQHLQGVLRTQSILINKGLLEIKG